MIRDSLFVIFKGIIVKLKLVLPKTTNIDMTIVFRASTVYYVQAQTLFIIIKI